MTRTRPLTFLAGAAAVPLIALIAPGCGGGGDERLGDRPADDRDPDSPATVGVANEGDLGSILVDSRGRTLYLFQKDYGTPSALLWRVRQAWPPLRATGRPTTGGEADPSLIGTSSRSDGRPRLRLPNGQPALPVLGRTRRRATSTARARQRSGRLARALRDRRRHLQTETFVLERRSELWRRLWLLADRSRSYRSVPAIAWPSR